MQQQQEPQRSHGERPYRSHLRPACLPCRRRKSRCQTEAGADVCLMCRAHGTECQYPGDSSNRQPPRPSPSKSTPPTKRRRRSNLHSRTPGSANVLHGGPHSQMRTLSDNTQIAHQSPMERTRLPNFMPSPAHASAGHGLTDRDHHNMYAEGFDSSADDHAQTFHIIGPALTKDNQVLSDYLSAIPGATRGTRTIIPIPASKSQPVLFTRVQRRPVGVSLNRSPAAEKLVILENLLGSSAAEIIDIYFRKVNVCLPLLDEVLFRRQYQADKDRISPALISTLFAHTIVHWNASRAATPNLPSPDSRFMWNLANDAVYSELHLSPGMSIIKAILLNVGGHPTTSLIGNGVLLGSAVSMAHSLGLNHNPLPWEIPQSEKYLRMKIWWALLVQDRWASLAHGTPPHISKIQYDVPLPTMAYLCEDATIGSHDSAAAIFVALLGLTEVLDQLLQYIYNFSKEKTHSIANLELSLNNWVESLTGTVRLVILRGTNLDVPGASNLRLSYLTTRLLLQRIELESDKHLYTTHDQRLSNRYIQARRTAEEILLLTQELKPEQLNDFWLSTHTFSYPATVNFLLRCGLETENSPSELVQSASFRIAHDLICTLRVHKEQHSWVLADVCLAQHSEIVEKILASGSADSQSNDGAFDPEEFVMPDASIVDQFFPSLWDPLQNAW